MDSEIVEGLIALFDAHQQKFEKLEIALSESQQTIQRLEQDVQRVLQRGVVQQANRELELEQIKGEIESLKLLTSVRGPTLDGGKLPPYHTISNISAQVFHTPDVPSKAKWKSVWSLRLTVYVGGQRCAEEINVALHQRDDFARRLKRSKGDVPATLRELLEKGYPDLWLGLIRQHTFRRGSPLIRDQVCAMRHHIPQPQPPDDLTLRVVQIEGGETLVRSIDQWRPAGGNRGGHALWWGESGK
jgi:hypothetical protein